MKYKSLVCILTVVSMLASAFLAMPVLANGPKTPTLLIHIYDTDVAEFEAFQSNIDENAIDLLDWPLPKDKVDLWQTPAYAGTIELRDYSDVGIYEVDINSQRWPTGNTLPRVWDELSVSYKHYYDETNPVDVKAKEFRKGIAYLADREGWKNRILKGYGTVQHTSVPIPACAGYTDYADLDAKGLLYHYNTVKAAQTFDAAGFTQGTTANPYYDPATPGSAQYLRIDPVLGGDLQALEFYIRMDDVLRRDVGRELTAQMRKAGLRVDAIETDRTVCYNQAMVLYDYHLYTGGWSLSIDNPLSIHGLWHSSQYWGGTEIGYLGGVGWSGNYCGFADYENDAYCEICKYSGDFDAIKQAALDAQERQQELVSFICAYSRLAVTAYKKGWNGLVDFRGFGPQATPWSHLNGINTINTPQNPADNELDWSFKSTLSGPNIVTSEWLWDAFIGGVIYEGMILRNPYDTAKDYGMLAETWSFNTDEASALFTLRPGITFHNGDPITPEDIKFAIEFNKACGPGVAWGYSTVEDILGVDTATDDETLGERDVKVYFGSPSYFSVHNAGYWPIISKNIWMAANDRHGWGYTRGMTDFNAFTNRMLVRNYNLWEEDGDGDGNTDYEEDGAGAYIYQSHAPGGPISTATSISLAAFTSYCVPTAAVSGYLDWSFHNIGDVSDNKVIDAGDGLAIQKGSGTDTTWPHGTDWDQYNPLADINYGTWDMIGQAPDEIGDGLINYLDLGKWGVNFGSPT